MTTYAVTGATGGLGHHAVLSLLARGVAASDVVALVRDPARAADLADLGVVVRVHLAALVDAGLPGPVAQFVVSIDAARAAGQLFTDSGDLARLLGRPTTPLREFLATVV